FVSIQNSFAFAIVRPFPDRNKTETIAGDYLKASTFVKMSAREFAAVTGKKLNFFQKIYFKIIKARVRHDLKKTPDLLMAAYIDQKTGKFKFDPLWFVIGTFIGPIGVLLSYYSHQQKNGPNKKNRTTSAWIGFGLWILWFGFLFLF
ncbi:MAG: hypothetical protein ACRDE5_16130, partial [Ginsengibacter sp.]